jgi:hypothetical protein
MGGVRYRAVCELRRTWRSLLLSGLLVGLAAGVALAAAAGARRNGSAYDRMLEEREVGQLFVNSLDDAGYDRAAAVDGVAEAARFDSVQLYPVAAIGRTDFFVAPSATSRGVFGYEVDEVNLRDGRLPDREAPFEAIATREMVARLGLRTGDRVEAVAVSPETQQPIAIDGQRSVELTIVGTGALASDIVPVTYNDDYAHFVLSPALLDLVPAHDRSDGGMAIRVEPGVDPADLLDDLQEAVGPDGYVDDRADDDRVVRQALRPQATALSVFAVLAGGTVLLVVAQVLGRQVQQRAADDVTLRALGLRRVDLVLLAGLRGLVLGMVVAVVAVAVAVAASPLFPIGPARWAEPSRGVDLDLAVLAIGGVGVLLVVVGAMAVAAFVGSGRRAVRPVRTSRVARALRSLFSGPGPAIGVGLAVSPGRGERTAGWSAVFGASAAVATFLLAATFGAGLDHLLETPARYGQDWDVMLDTAFDHAPVGVMRTELGDDDAVEAIAGGHYGDVRVNGATVPAVGLTDITGTTFPTVVEGRAPTRDDELTLGATTMSALGVDLGDEVSVDTGGGARAMTLVGRVVLPRLSHGSISALGLGNGAVLRTGAFPGVRLEDQSETVPSQAELDTFAVEGVAYEFATVRFSSHASLADRKRITARLRESGAFIRTEQQPSAVSNYGRVRSTTTPLAAILATLAAASLTHALIASVRHHRRDLALLKVVGLRRRHVRRAVAWQAGTLAVLALLVGMPLGVAAGRLAWRWFADDLGVVSDPVVPVAVVALVVPATLVLALAVAVIPAWRAARTRPGVTLRTE